jgi:transposase
MQSRELFRLALGLRDPWEVTEVKFSEGEGRLDIRLDFPAGSRFECPECGHAGCAVHDTQERTWRHLNFFQHQTHLHARQPRVSCPEHGVKTVEVPWARPGVGFTLLFEAFMMALLENGMTPRQVGRVMGEHDTRVWRVLMHHVERARGEADHSGVSSVGMDETSRARGHDYITVFMDLEKPRVLYATQGRDSGTVRRFREDLEAHGGKAANVQEACLDMSPAYIRGLGEEFPQAQMTFDRFHLMKLMNEAVDEVRRQEQKAHPELKKTRYLWLKNSWNHTEREAEAFERLRCSKLKTARAWLLRNVFQDISAEEEPSGAEGMLQHWYFWATHSRLQPMIEAARTIKRHWQGVLRAFTSAASNGLLEAINGLIQSAKAKARGYRSTRYLITMVYLIAGKLDFGLPRFGWATHTK